MCYGVTMMNNKTTIEYTLPVELASGFINNDWSILDYIGDSEYDKSIAQFVLDCERNGIDFVDADTENVSFVKYHDLSDYGVLATDCCTFYAG